MGPTENYQDVGIAELCMHRVTEKKVLEMGLGATEVQVRSKVLDLGWPQAKEQKIPRNVSLNTQHSNKMDVYSYIVLA